MNIETEIIIEKQIGISVNLTHNTIIFHMSTRNAFKK